MRKDELYKKQQTTKLKKQNERNSKMRQHYKNLIEKLLTVPDKTQAIAEAIAQEQDPQAKNELIKIKNKYFKE